MTGAAKRKGDRAELEAAALIQQLLGVPARRKLGAGRQDDEGDIDGVPDTAVQVVSRTADVVSVAVVRKPVEADQQAARAGATFAATFVRIRGGTWRVVLTPEAWATYWREATAPSTAMEQIGFIAEALDEDRQPDAPPQQPTGEWFFHYEDEDPESFAFARPVYARPAVPAS